MSDCLSYCRVFSPPLRHQRSLLRRARAPKRPRPPLAWPAVVPLGCLEDYEKKRWRGRGWSGRKRRGTEQTEREPIAEPHVSRSLGFQSSTAGEGRYQMKWQRIHTSTTGRSGRACWERKQRERQRTYTRTAGQLVLPRRDSERSPLLPHCSAGRGRGVHILHRTKKCSEFETKWTS